MSLHRVPAQITPPGRIVARELEARGWTQKHLATLIGRPVQAINQIIKGTKQITPQTALAFAEVFGTSAEFWVNLEAHYQLNLARQKQNEAEKVKMQTLSHDSDGIPNPSMSNSRKALPNP